MQLAFSACHQGPVGVGIGDQQKAVNVAQRERKRRLFVDQQLAEQVELDVLRALGQLVVEAD